MANDSNREYANRLSIKYGRTATEDVRRYGPYTWRWQQPLSGVIAWDQVERCWARAQDCWCHEGEDEDGEEVEIVGDPVEADQD